MPQKTLPAVLSTISAFNVLQTPLQLPHPDDPARTKSANASKAEAVCGLALELSVQMLNAGMLTILHAALCLVQEEGLAYVRRAPSAARPIAAKLRALADAFEAATPETVRTACDERTHAVALSKMLAEEASSTTPPSSIN